jgi:HD-GYP domain-containing protein (c-di-GMP phosphodiesterase class II)
MVTSVLTRGTWGTDSGLASESLTGLDLRTDERDVLTEVKAEAAQDLTIRLAQKILEGDVFTREHSSRVAVLSVALGIRMGLGRDALQLMWRAGEWHDTGKREMRDLVYAERPLTAEEMEAMREHPVISACFSEQHGMENTVVQLALGHHSLAKNPYPAGFELRPGRGVDEAAYNQLTQQLAIIAVADLYDALRSARPYRPEIMSRDKAVEIIRSDYIGPSEPLEALVGLTRAV